MVFHVRCRGQIDEVVGGFGFAGELRIPLVYEDLGFHVLVLVYPHLETVASGTLVNGYLALEVYFTLHVLPPSVIGF